MGILQCKAKVNNISDISVSGEPSNNAQDLTAEVTSQARLVEQGEMTPFGTMVHKQQSATTAKTPQVELTAFEKYLQDQSKKKGANHHKGKVKRKHSGDGLSTHIKHTDTASPNSKKKTTEGSSTFKRGGTEGKNFFDGISKRTYKEADFSRYHGRKHSGPRLEHHFMEDGEGSDVEIGDEIDEDERVVEEDSADIISYNSNFKI